MTKGNGIPGLEKRGVYFFINDYDIEKIQKNGEIITKLYNNNDLISPDGELVDSYRKVFLLAFGEYNPFKDTFIEKIIPGTDTFMEGSGISNVTAGNEIKLMEMGKWKFAPQICYEIIIPHFTRLFTNLGSDFIVNSTNDRWFGKSKASKQHLLLGLPRAIENRNYIVRATNSGISTVISATGKIKSFSSHNGEVMFSPLYKQDYMVAEITPINIDTFYKNHGEYFAYLILSLFILFIIYIVWMKFYIKFIK
jgi:apolipoprotein N-acyltransferase